MNYTTAELVTVFVGTFGVSAAWHWTFFAMTVTLRAFRVTALGDL